MYSCESLPLQTSAFVALLRIDNCITSSRLFIDDELSALNERVRAFDVLFAIATVLVADFPGYHIVLGKNDVADDGVQSLALQENSTSAAYALGAIVRKRNTAKMVNFFIDF